jgi:hypothetical protein
MPDEQSKASKALQYRRQPLHELQRRHHQVRRAVAPRPKELRWLIDARSCAAVRLNFLADQVSPCLLSPTRINDRSGQ